jgi:Arc/MetJ-type ribon-helix-helix transcriptional regulator
MKTLTVKLPEPLFAQIASHAKARNVSKSEIVRERLMQDRSSRPRAKATLWDRMEDLVIPSDSLPRDLAANKAHLRRYGSNRSH